MERKIVKIIFFILILLNIFITTSRAWSMGDIIQKGTDFINPPSGSTIVTVDESKIYELSKTISSILQVVSIAAALIMSMILGIKYITGTVEEQAKVKETLIPFIIGCFVAFGAFAIWKLVVNILNGVGI